MKYKHLVVAGFLLAAPVGPIWGATLKAKANIINDKGEKIGHADLKETKDGVKIALSVSRLQPGVHAFHIHENGKCALPDFKSAGGHFNPTHKQHGLKNPQGHHAGDLSNLEVKANGKGKIKVTVNEVTLKEGENSLFHPGGTAIVIHATADDNKTDPAGNAGNRIACGVIQKD